MSAADLGDLERIIHSTGFFRAKAKSLQGMARAVVERHGGVVPIGMDDLTKLPGVGRKTANVLRGSAHDLPAVIVDTHCSRVARRLGWTRSEDPVEIERDLMKLLPEADWTFTSHAFVLHGRAVCHSRRPACERCVLGAELCPSFFAGP
jgi:endonuclease-3